MITWEAASLVGILGLAVLIWAASRFAEALARTSVPPSE